MAKQGMKRPDITHTKPQNQAAAVPEIQNTAWFPQIQLLQGHTHQL